MWVYGRESETLDRGRDAVLRSVWSPWNSHLFLWSGKVIAKMKVVLSFYWENLDRSLCLDPSIVLPVYIYFLAFAFPFLGHIKFWVHCIPRGGHHEPSMAKGDCHSPKCFDAPPKAHPFPTECRTTVLDFHELFCALHPYDPNPLR